MMIHKDKCLELGLPAPKSYDTQGGYVTRVIAAGFNLNTRICRFVGIHNLHSIVSALYKKGVDFTLGHGRVLCPFTEETPPYPVDIIYMTTEQQSSYRKEKSAKA